MLFINEQAAARHLPGSCHGARIGIRTEMPVFTPDCLPGALRDEQFKLTQPLFQSAGFEEYHGGFSPLKKDFATCYALYFCTPDSQPN